MNNPGPQNYRDPNRDELDNPREPRLHTMHSEVWGYSTYSFVLLCSADTVGYTPHNHPANIDKLVGMVHGFHNPFYHLMSMSIYPAWCSMLVVAGLTWSVTADAVPSPLLSAHSPPLINTHAGFSPALATRAGLCPGGVTLSRNFRIHPAKSFMPSVFSTNAEWSIHIPTFRWFN